MKMRIKDFFNDLKNEPKEIYRKPIRCVSEFYYKFKRSLKWFYRTWNIYDWDGEYLIDIMLFKLKDIRYQLDVIDSCFVDLRHQPTGEFERVQLCNSEKDDSDSDEWIEVEKTEDRLASLDRAIELGEKILKDDYIHYTDEIQKWFDTNRSIFGGEKMPEDLHKKLMEIYKKSDEDAQRDREEFFNIIRDNYLYWWS